ncbi:MAG TPA: HAD-IA family hydrolase, partial [Planctomycetota bacterium]|nr:HAD-IA family hydrolase [Planctomycetota bacterium]
LCLCLCLPSHWFFPSSMREDRSEKPPETREESAALGPVEVVFFDVGGTLLRVETSVGAVYAEVAAEHGVRVDPKALDERFRQAWKRSIARSRARRFRCSDAILREEWLDIVTETFGREVRDEEIRAVFEALYERFVSGDAWKVVPGARETLRHLRERGLRLGVISNWDSRLPQTLAELGLDEFFEVLVISYEVGYEKPHERIFAEALRRTGASPEQVLHVGDSYEADIIPARSKGWRTLWIATGGASDGEVCVPDFSTLTPAHWDRLLGHEAR